jgi:hypothetical protein
MGHINLVVTSRVQQRDASARLGERQIAYRSPSTDIASELAWQAPTPASESSWAVSWTFQSETPEQFDERTTPRTARDSMRCSICSAADVAMRFLYELLNVAEQPCDGQEAI